MSDLSIPSLTVYLVLPLLMTCVLNKSVKTCRQLGSVLSHHWLVPKDELGIPAGEQTFAYESLARHHAMVGLYGGVSLSRAFLLDI